MSFQNQVAIVGIGETEYSRSSGRSELELSLEAIQAALQDAGIDRSEVCLLYTSPSPRDRG